MVKPYSVIMECIKEWIMYIVRWRETEREKDLVDDNTLFIAACRVESYNFESLKNVHLNTMRALTICKKKKKKLLGSNLFPTHHVLNNRFVTIHLCVCVCGMSS
jgi:hypothetical protein